MEPAAARNQFAALLPIRERVLGPEHPDTLDARRCLAYWTGEAGDPAAARDQLTALLAIRERVLGAGHPDTLDTRHILAYWTRMARQHDPPTGHLLPAATFWASGYAASWTGP